MNRKLSRTAIVLFVALIFLCALPYGFGLLTEKAYVRTVERLVKSYGLQVSESHYHRGWLGATAIMTLTHAGAPLQLRLTHHIAHGPFPYATRPEGQTLWLPVGAIVRSEGAVLAPQNVDTRTDAASPLMIFDTVVALDGKVESHVALRGGESPGGSRWGHGTGVMRFSPETRQSEFDLSLSDAAFAFEPLAEIANANLDLTEIHIVARFTEDPDGRIRGKATLALQSLAAPSLATLKDVRVDLISGANTGLIEINATPDIGAIIIGEKTLGALRFDMELRRVDMVQLSQINDIAGGLSNASAGTEELTLRALGRIVKLMSKLSKSAPEVEIRNFVFRAAEGDVRGGAKFTLDGRNLNTQQNPMLLLVALRGDADLSVPRPVMRTYFADRILRALSRQHVDTSASATEAGTTDPAATARIIDEALPAYMAKDELGRYFQPAGDQFKVKVSVRRGQVTINDRLWSGSGPATP